MLRYVIVLEVAVMGIFSAPVVQAAPSDKMTTVEAINACRAELGKDAKYLKVRTCVIKKKKGE
jgi:hypothetical protein